MNREKTINLILLGLMLIGISLVAIRQFQLSRGAPVPAMFSAKLDLERAVEVAEQQDKYVFAVASANWCGACQVYKRGALADERVSQWMSEHAIPVFIDVDQSQDAARVLRVGPIPSTYVLKGKTIVGQVDGAVGADALLDWLDRVDALAAAEDYDG